MELQTCKKIRQFGAIYRYEQSGELHGLTRVRFTQDDTPFLDTRSIVRRIQKTIDLVLYDLVLWKFYSSNFIKRSRK